MWLVAFSAPLRHTHVAAVEIHNGHALDMAAEAAGISPAHANALLSGMASVDPSWPSPTMSRLPPGAAVTVARDPPLTAARLLTPAAAALSLPPLITVPGRIPPPAPGP